MVNEPIKSEIFEAETQRSLCSGIVSFRNSLLIARCLKRGFRRRRAASGRLVPTLLADCTSARVAASLSSLGPRVCSTSRTDCSQRLAALYRARSRLCRSQILQVNMRLKALAEIYTMHSFAQLQNHIFSKN